MPALDRHSGRKSGIDAEIRPLPGGLVREEEGGSTRGVGLQAQHDVHPIARPDGEIDLRAGPQRDLRGDVLARVDRHLDVNIEEAEAEERAEEDGASLGCAVMQVRDDPPARKDGEGRVEAGELEAARLAREQTEGRCDGVERRASRGLFRLAGVRSPGLCGGRTCPRWR